MYTSLIQYTAGRYLILSWLILVITLSSCNPPARSDVVAPTDSQPTPQITPTLLPSSTPTLLPTQTPAPTVTPTQTLSPSPTPTATLTPIPTYIILRGEVLLRSNCRYGPGAPYLYKYGLVPGSNLEIIGRNDLGTWLLVQAIGGHNPCWVKASLMQPKGDVMNVAPTYIALPPSPYYAPPTGVFATRTGDEVTITWNPIQFRAGDDTAEAPYLIEAWLCTGGQVVFTPLGSYATTATLLDGPGCSQPSHARLFGVEKHGYTLWVEIPWPAHRETAALEPPGSVMIGGVELP